MERRSGRWEVRMGGMGCLEPVMAGSVGGAERVGGPVRRFAEGVDSDMVVGFRTRVDLAMWMELAELDAVRFLPRDLARGLVASPALIDTANQHKALVAAIGAGAAASGMYARMFVDGAARDPDLIPEALTGIEESDMAARVRAAARAFPIDTDVPVELVEEDLRDALHMTGEYLSEELWWRIVTGTPNHEEPPMLRAARSMLMAEPAHTREAGEALVAALRRGEETRATLPGGDAVAMFDQRVQAEAVGRLHALRGTYKDGWPEPYLAATDPERLAGADESKPTGLDEPTTAALRDWRDAMEHDDWPRVIEAYDRFKEHRHGHLPASIINDTYRARWDATIATSTPTRLTARELGIITKDRIAPELADYHTYGISAITTNGTTINGPEAALRYAANILNDPTNLRYASPKHGADAAAVIREATGNANDPKWRALSAILTAILQRTEERRSRGYDPDPYQREPRPRTGTTQRA